MTHNVSQEFSEGDDEPSSSIAGQSLTLDVLGDSEGLSLSHFLALFEACLAREGLEAVTSEISLKFCDDAAIAVINKTWRQKDKPTNVLSFPALEPDEIDELADAVQNGDVPTGPPVHWGDIIVSNETLAREALLENKTLDDHRAHLLVHGMLHLLGYDHIEDDEAEHMENLERQILANFNIEDPYQEKESNVDE